VNYTAVPTDHQWAASRVAQLPTRWQRKLLTAWDVQRATFDRTDWRAEEAAHRTANLSLLHLTDTLGAVRLPLDATDANVCERATQLANQCGELAQVFHTADLLRAAMSRKADANGVTPPAATIADQGAIRRMTDPLWWRRGLRKCHAKAVEGAAIALGYVNKTSDIYVSNESLTRRAQQNKRNADTLDATIARNELGQEYTLAELAAKGTANKAIRRAELMTRISGFERIARDMSHAGLFFTITCPSRMHKWRTVAKGRVMENPKYDGTTPREAQSYLATVWARIRASLKRQGVGIYGFRIAEPNHDGTPHWHLLVFHVAGHFQTLRDTVRRYALEDSPSERGADRHRVDFKAIDWTRGSAAGYIAKYVAKNIDGYKVDQDLYGNDALETSARVEAWAATWGIRQFQQVGGPPVGPWRELRRVKDMPDAAPAHLKQAHRAVNKLAVIEGRDNASVAWDSYCQAQGGVFCGRDYRIRITKQEVDGLGRYGDPIAPKHIGLETTSLETYTPTHMAWMTPRVFATRVVHWFVESTRHVWEIVGRMGRAIGKGFIGTGAKPSAPWTRVNNCTEGVSNGNRTNEKPTRGPSGRMGQGPSHYQSDGGGLFQPAT
jgi:hypothetical protein